MGTVRAYCRVSTISQHLDRQLIAMREYGIAEEMMYVEKISGKNTKRPELQRLMAEVCRGDTVVVESISRFARNTRDLLDLVDQLSKKGVDFISQKEHIDTTTPTGKFVLTIFGAIFEMDRNTILQRAREGVAAARLRGGKFGRPIKSPPENFGKLIKSWERGEISFSELKKETGLKEATLYRRIAEFRAARK